MVPRPMSVLSIDRRLLALTLCLFCVGCVARGAHDPSAGQAVLTVKKVEAGIEHGDFRPAHLAYDYPYRLEEVLGDLWRGGPRADQDALVALSESIFEETTRKQWADCCAGRTMTVLITNTDDNNVWVTSRAPREPDSRAAFEWQYRLTRRGDTWAITQREFRDQRGQRSGSNRFWPVAIAQITEMFGRTPTLQELTANLPSVQGKLRSRTYTLDPKRSPNR